MMARASGTKRESVAVTDNFGRLSRLKRRGGSRLAAALVVMATSAPMAPAATSEQVATSAVSAQLITAENGVAPGAGAISAGLALELGEGWKTYWRTPVKTCPILTRANSDRRMAAIASASSTAPSACACAPSRVISAPPFCRSGISRVASEAMASR